MVSVKCFCPVVCWIYMAKRADCTVTRMCSYTAHKTAVVIICTVCQTEIPTFLGSSVTNMPVKILYPQKNPLCL